MRNADRIRELEKEIGRRDKKILDQSRELEELRKEAAVLRKGSSEVQRAVDAILATVTLQYGVRAVDPDSGEDIGWRLAVPGFDVAGTLKRYEVHARRGEDGYMVGVAERK